MVHASAAIKWGFMSYFSRFKHSSKIFYWPSNAVLLLWIINVISVLFLLCFRARLFIDALWPPAGKGLTFWFSFVMSNCEIVTFPLVSWVRCGAWLYWCLIFALFLLILVYFFYLTSDLNDFAHVKEHSLIIYTIGTKISKWVWSGNTTITNRRQPHGTWGRPLND